MTAKGFMVEEDVQKDLFPNKPFRVAQVLLKGVNGMWLEFVPMEALPDFKKS